jgi:hypothetical protein
MPRQKLVKAVDRIVRDVGQHLAQPRFRVDTAQFGCADRRVVRRGAFATAVGTGEQIIAAADGNAPQRPLCGRVVDLDDAISAVAYKGGPQIEGVHDRRRRIEFARQLLERSAQPATLASGSVSV